MGTAVIEAYMNIVAATIARQESNERHLDDDEHGCRTPPHDGASRPPRGPMQGKEERGGRESAEVG